MSTKPAVPFVTGLDGLRGIAALCVALYHLPFVNPATGWPVVKNGYLWVDAFFVLSGYVMAHAYSGRLATWREARDYLWLRFGRVYPLHLLVTLAFLGVEVARWWAANRGGTLASPPFSVNSPGALAANLLLVHAHGVTSDLTFNGPSWSIAAEFTAYLAFAAVSLLRPTLAVRAGGALLLAAVLFGALYWWHPANLDITYSAGAVRCLAGFSLGLVVHHLTTRGGAARWAVAAQGAGGAGLLGVLGLSQRGSLDYLLPWVVAVLIFGLVAKPTSLLGRGLGVRPLAWLGTVSYSVYMTHGLVLRVGLSAAQALGWTGSPQVSAAAGAGWALAFVVALLALSAVTFRFVEEPARLWARRRLTSKAAVPAAAPQPGRA